MFITLTSTHAAANGGGANRKVPIADVWASAETPAGAAIQRMGSNTTCHQVPTGSSNSVGRSFCLLCLLLLTTPLQAPQGRMRQQYAISTQLPHEKQGDSILCGAGENRNQLPRVLVVLATPYF